VGEPAPPTYDEAPFDMMRNVNLLVAEHCSNTCEHCSTGSPFLGKQTHPAAGFFPWLDALVRGGVEFNDISLTGGEPFLHPEVRDGSFMRALRERYPDKRVNATTNFYWGSERLIERFAPAVAEFFALDVSLYANLVERLGGQARVHELLDLLAAACPSTIITPIERPTFIAWELHEEERPVQGPCVTSDCFILRPDGRISHCSIAIGAEGNPAFAPILASTSEGLFDIARGVEGFREWADTYPFDLCRHCTMWHEDHVPLRFLDRHEMSAQRRSRTSSTEPPLPPTP